MQFSQRFYRAAAIASILSALTTLGLIFLPDLSPPVPDLDARMALGTHPAYVLRSWIYLVHPFLIYDVVWDSMYFLLLWGFLAGNLLLGWAVPKLRRVESGTSARRDSLGAWVTAAFWAAAALTFLLLVPELDGPAAPGTDWLYPLIQPAGRALIGVWLWRASSGLERAPGSPPESAHGVVPR